MLQVNRPSESGSLKMRHGRFSEPSSSQMDGFHQVDSKFNHLAATPSSSCQMEGLNLRNNANDNTSGRGEQLNGVSLRTTLSKIPKSAQSKVKKNSKTEMERDERSESKSFQSNQAKDDNKVEMGKWHKLMDDYERLQLVASSRARNKLIDSTSESSDDSISQASTVFETVVAQGSNSSKPLTRELSGSVGQCLDELVEAVATKPEPVPYKVFSLHEAVCAKTNSGSSATTTSASEDGSSCDELSRSSQKGPNRVVVELWGRSEVIADDCEILNTNQILARAREFVRDSESRLSGSKTRIVSVALNTTGRSIDCFDENNNKYSIDLNQVADCLQDQELIVWLLDCSQQPNDYKQDNELDLDDIALALNEPVANRPQRQQARPRLEALAWTCARGSGDAKRLQSVWLQHQIAHRKQVASEQMNLIEVRPNEMAAKQMRSSGLFVLQTGSSGTERDQTSRKNDQLQIRKPIHGAKLGEQPREGSRDHQRSAGGLDLANSRGNGHKDEVVSIQTQTGASHQSAQVNQSNLANYYRNVASKVLSNGSSRLKNFTLESGHTLARGARRLSLAINQQMPQQNYTPTGSSGDTNKQLHQDPSEKVAPKAKPRTSVLKRDNASDFVADQQRNLDSETTKRASERPVQSNGHLSENYHDQITPTAQFNEFDQTKSHFGGTRRAMSVSSRARQRRPALLLTNPNWGQEQDQEQERPVANVSRSSQIDGTVRAKVSMSHLRRSASMKVLSVEDCAQADRVQRQQVQADGEPPTQAGKKSEFDPRSLRKLSCSETARALRCSQTEKNAAASGEVSAVCTGNGAAGQDERRLMRDRVRRRKSLANLSELRFELDDADEESATLSTAVAGPSEVTGGQKLGKNLNLLRQSFKQKNLSKAIMSFATNRQSLRVKKSSLGDAAPRASVARHGDEEVSLADGWPSDKQTQQQRPEVLLSSRQQKLEAIELAEANLLAARQLKQQAQRLRELQRRNEQQPPPQTSMAVDQAAILFYNQQMQMQQQQQQIYQAQQQQQQQQQHYAFSSGYNQQMFDTLSLYHHHTQQQQQQPFAHQLQPNRQPQLAYLSNHSAHFMAASTAAAAAQHQMAFVQTAPATGAGHLYPVGRMPSLSLGSMPALIGQQLATSPLQQQQQQQQATLQLDHNQSALINRQQRSSLAKYQQQQQLQQSAAYLMTTDQQQFIPMSVNHHSSFNIVYTAAAAAAAANQHQQQQQQQQMAAAAAAVAASQHQANQFNISPYLTSFVKSNQNSNQVTMQQQQFLTEIVAQTEPVQSPAGGLRSKQSSLGASVRKTMRSILRNGRSVASYAVPASKSQSSSRPQPVVQQQRPLKSALKASSNLKEPHQLNSEGSDASDASSSSSTSSDSGPTRNEQIRGGGGGGRVRNKTSGLQVKQQSSPAPTSFPASSSSSSSSPSSSSNSSLASSSTPTKHEAEELSGEFSSSSGGGTTSCSYSTSTLQTTDDGHERGTASERLAASRTRASLGPAVTMANQRKNVTFSTKLTSIL